MVKHVLQVLTFTVVVGLGANATGQGAAPSVSRTRSIEELLAALGAATDNAKQLELYHLVEAAVQADAGALTEALLIRPAAQAPTPIEKALIFSIFSLVYKIRSEAPLPTSSEPEAPTIFADPDVRSAAIALIQNDTVVTEGGEQYELVGERVAQQLVSRHLPAVRRAVYTLWNGAGIPVSWYGNAALAVVEGRTVSPLPIAAKMSAKEFSSMIAGWKGSTGPRILEEFDALPIDQHLAIVARLAGMKKWALWIIEAQMTIKTARRPDGVDLPVEQWVGRKWDQQLRAEIGDALAKEALKERSYEIDITAENPLSGLALSCHGLTEESSSTIFLHGGEEMAHRPPPEAALRWEFVHRPYGEDLRNTKAARTHIPIWESEAINGGWKREFGSLTAPHATKASHRGVQPYSYGYAAMETARMLNRLEAGDPQAIASFGIHVSCAPPSLERELPPTIVVTPADRARFTNRILPRVEIQDASIQEVIELLSYSFRDVGLLFNAPPDTTMSKVSYNATGVSTLQVLDDLCGRMNLYWRFSAQGITIGAKEELNKPLK